LKAGDREPRRGKEVWGRRHREKKIERLPLPHRDYARKREGLRESKNCTGDGEGSRQPVSGTPLLGDLGEGKLHVIQSEMEGRVPCARCGKGVRCFPEGFLA